MQTNDSYLNKTANKDLRPVAFTPLFVVWHGTGSPNPSNPNGTLDYNLASSVQSSYNYLIAQDGTIYHYVDERLFVAWHAGLRSKGVPASYTLNGQTHTGYDINVQSIGVEIDGLNDGTPITPAQRDSAIALVHFFQTQYGIPASRPYHLGHKEIAPPPYKHDPQDFSVDVLLQLANATPPPIDPNLAAWGTASPFHQDWRIPQAWLPHKDKLGKAISVPVEIAPYTFQLFEHGVIIFSDAVGAKAYIDA